MMQGAGRNNIFYMYFKSYEYNNAPGGICNGITGGVNNPDDIDFNLGFAVTGKDEDWRWGEQWLPHAAWYLYAVSSAWHYFKTAFEQAARDFFALGDEDTMCFVYCRAAHRAIRR
jgi:hypothetical protein